MIRLRLGSLASLNGRRRLFFFETSNDDGLELDRLGLLGGGRAPKLLFPSSARESNEATLATDCLCSIDGADGKEMRRNGRWGGLRWATGWFVSVAGNVTDDELAEKYIRGLLRTFPKTFTHPATTSCVLWIIKCNFPPVVVRERPELAESRHHSSFFDHGKHEASHNLTLTRFCSGAPR